MSTVYIGIGSNLGDRQNNCLRSIELLSESQEVIVNKISSLYETTPWQGNKQPNFINMAVEIETTLTPERLLLFIKGIEKKMGRRKSYKWGPRLIDLDILIYNSIVLEKADLKIPHPHMHKRDFVLRPLNEIAPEVQHPCLHLSIKELFRQLSGETGLTLS